MDLTWRDAPAADTVADANPFRLYHYNPTIPGAVIFALLFLSTTLLHFWQLFRNRCWFMLPLATGGILEMMGYAARAKSGTESPDWTLGPYIVQAILLLVAPALFAATIYMELGRIITVVDGESHTLIRKQWMTKLFVTGDILSFVLQAGGGGYQAAGSLEALNSGAKVIIAGLFVQLICFGCFIVIAVAFHLAVNRTPTVRSRSTINWKRHMRALYLGSFLIMVRSVFRAVEYLQGFNGYLLSHEAYLYIFDAVLMFFAMAWFNHVHPAEISRVLRGGEDNQSWNLGSIPQYYREQL
ncbi:RTA1 protein [Thozetella sp. PMI_491]|nr:RTA1 protein [Thozetella sp. PMI_491]